MFALLTIFSSLFSGCGITENREVPNILRDLSYADGKDESQYTVFLEENGELTPYLVLTDQYNDRTVCLLVRKYVMDDSHIYNENASFSGYYADSDIDQFLNGEFWMTLPESLQEILSPSQITITKKSSLGCCGKETETITRNIFLLSAVEVGGTSSPTVVREGKSLAYFSSNEQRIAQTSDGVPVSWWLRTPNTWYDNVVCGVSTNGAIGIGGVGGAGEENSYKSGVRPAFCLDAETKISIEGVMFRIVY